MGKQIKKTCRVNNKVELHQLMVGMWNVRGTFDEGALKHLIQDLVNYKLDLIASQETNQKEKPDKSMFICFSTVVEMVIF